jgi:energy-coupling factor transport system permease protein
LLREYIQRTGSRNPDCVFENLHPGCKLVIVIIATALIIFDGSIISVSVFAIAAATAVFSRLSKVFFIMTILAVIFWAIFLLLFKYILKRPLEEPVSLFYGVVFRGVSLGFAGIWFAVTTKLRDLTSALEAWHIPYVIILPLTIAVRFIPTLFNEALTIRDSMLLRGIYKSKTDSLKNAHLITVSFMTLVLIRSLKMADELAAVAETRGLGSPSKPYRQRRRLTRNEYVLLIAVFLFAITMLVINFTAGATN